MARSDDPNEGSIADTGMFRRFVENEEALEQRDGQGRHKWIAIVAAVVIIAVAVVVYLLVR